MPYIDFPLSSRTHLAATVVAVLNRFRDLYVTQNITWLKILVDGAQTVSNYKVHRWMKSMPLLKQPYLPNSVALSLVTASTHSSSS